VQLKLPVQDTESDSENGLEMPGIVRLNEALHEFVPPLKGSFSLVVDALTETDPDSVEFRSTSTSVSVPSAGSKGSKVTVVLFGSLADVGPEGLFTSAGLDETVKPKLCVIVAAPAIPTGIRTPIPVSKPI
jgi:hypothetical protein